MTNSKNNQVQVATKASTTLLNHSTNSAVCATNDRDTYMSFLDAFKKIGGMVNDVTVKAIKHEIEKHSIDSYELERALILAHSDSRIVGNLQWRHVLMHVFENRKESLYGTISE